MASLIARARVNVRPEFTPTHNIGRGLTVDAQKREVAKFYRAEVGRAKGTNTFEVLPIPDAIPEDAFPAVPQDAIKEVYEVPASDPLSELLGRKPKRLAPGEEPPASQSLLPRPFPSKLLRPN